MNKEVNMSTIASAFGTSLAGCLYRVNPLSSSFSTMQSQAAVSLMNKTKAYFSSYTWPVPDSKKITQGFGRGHNGIDIAPKAWRVPGDKIISFYPGTIARAGWSNSYGWVVYVNHTIKEKGDKPYQSRYAHMHKKPDVTTNQKVSAGTKLGEMGATGQVDPPGVAVHLHFETRQCSEKCAIDNSSTPVDPIKHFFPEIKDKASKSIFTDEEEIFYDLEEINRMTRKERLEKGIPEG